MGLRGRAARSHCSRLIRERPDRWLLTNQAIEWLRDPGSTARLGADADVRDDRDSRSA